MRDWKKSMNETGNEWQKKTNEKNITTIFFTKISYWINFQYLSST